MRTILVIEAHPDPTSFGTALARAYATGARRVGAKVTTLSLTELSFHPVMRGFSENLPLEPDLQQAQGLIEEADHLMIQFPVWWGNLPALLKGFIDRTFLPGWAFQQVPGQRLPEPGLSGRSARIISTMDSPRVWYWWKHGRAAHRSLTHATLHYVGIYPVSETTIYQLRTLSESARGEWLQRAEALGEADAQRREKEDERKVEESKPSQDGS